MLENPFAELQHPQQSSLGAMLATPQAPPPAQQQVSGASPPASMEEYSQRVQGWTGALQQLISNPQVAAALVQMGTGLSSGLTGGEAVAAGFGAMGRAGAIGEDFRQQGEKEDLLRRRMAMDEGVAEAHTRMYNAQAANYERLAKGGGGRGGVGKAGPTDEDLESEYKRCMTLPGADEATCRQAVLKLKYKLSPGKYSPEVVGEAGGMTPDQRARNEKRRSELETLQNDSLGKGLTPEQQKELRDLNMRLDGTAWRPSQAEPQMPTGPAQIVQPPAPNATGAPSPLEAVMSFGSKAEADAAGAANKIPLGTVVLIGTKRFVWR